MIFDKEPIISPWEGTTGQYIFLSQFLFFFNYLFYLGVVAQFWKIICRQILLRLERYYG